MSKKLNSGVKMSKHPGEEEEAPVKKKRAPEEEGEEEIFLSLDDEGYELEQFLARCAWKPP